MKPAQLAVPFLRQSQLPNLALQLLGWPVAPDVPIHARGRRPGAREVRWIGEKRLACHRLEGVVLPQVEAGTARPRPGALAVGK
jgi:hypothetical protein